MLNLLIRNMPLLNILRTLLIFLAFFALKAYGTPNAGYLLQPPGKGLFFECTFIESLPAEAEPEGGQSPRCTRAENAPFGKITESTLVTYHKSHLARIHKVYPHCFMENRTDRLELVMETICLGIDKTIQYWFRTVWPTDARAKIYYRSLRLEELEQSMSTMRMVRNKYEGKMPPRKSLLYSF